MDNLLVLALKNKYRFNFKGIVSVEDLFDLSLEDLDKIHRDLNRQAKASSEESLLSKKTNSDEVLDNKIEIVKYIFNIKKTEQEERVREASRKVEREKIMAILATKKEESLANKTEEELEEMLKNL